MLPLVVRAPDKSLNSGCLDDRLSFPPVVHPICTPAGEIDSESLLLPKWTGWDPGSVTDDALSVFHPVLSRQRHTSARSRSSPASIFAPRIIPDAVENSNLSTRHRKTDAPVELSYAVDSDSTPPPRPQIQQSLQEKSGIVWKRPFNRRLKTTVSVILSLLRRTHCSLSWTGRIRDKSKTSQPQRQASYDFKRAEFVLNVHTDVTDEEQSLNVLPIQAMMHYCFGAAASGLFASLHSVSFNNYWSSSPRSRSIQKAFTFNSTTICTTKPTAPNIQSKAIIIPLKRPHAWRRQPPFL